MVKAIDFAVRDSAGGVVRGAVAGDAGSKFVQMGIGDEISLNLSRQSVASFVQKGDDLVLSLIDGRQVTLDGFFNRQGEPNQLYLSQNGEIVAVELAPTGNGTLQATYGGIDGWEKFSSMDSLRFAAGDDVALAGGIVEEPAGMGVFVPGLLGIGGGAAAAVIGAGVIGGAIIGGGGKDGGGKDGGGGRAPLAVDPQNESTVIIVTADKTLDVSGTGEPGDTVVVTIGDKTETTTIDANGKWNVTFPETNLPADGEYIAKVVGTTPEGKATELPGPEFLIDLTPPDVAITGGAKSSGDIENLVDYDAKDGITITGKGEIGAKIDVTVEGTTHSTTVDSNGNWSVTYSESEIRSGEYYETGITVVATDVNGNTTTITDTLVVDTVPYDVSFDAVTDHNVVDFAENSAGFTISGGAAGTGVAGAELVVTVTAGSTVITKTVVVSETGTWSLAIDKDGLPGGEYDATVTVTGRDGAGNVTNEQHSFRVDTIGNVAFDAAKIAGDDIVNGSEAASVTLTGTSEPGTTSVIVTWNGQNVAASVDASGAWSATFANIAGTDTLTQSTATVTAVDAWGNSSSDSRSISVDLGTSVAFDATQMGDNVISGGERRSGVTLTGSGEPGATLVVSFENGTRSNIVVGADGTWSAAFNAADIANGNGRTATATVTATDAAGNTASATKTLVIDTQVAPLTVTADATANGDGVVNAAESRGHYTVSGTVEKGATGLVVSFDGTDLAAGLVSVDAVNGTWTARIPQSLLANTDLTSKSLVVTATDAYGNTGSTSHALKIDTIVSTLTQTGKIAGDNIVNAAEAANGIQIAGAVEVGSAVIVTLSTGQKVTATVAANGSWTANLDATSLPSGERDITYTVTATDKAGNSRTIGDDGSLGFRVDTVAPDAPVIVNDLGNGNLLNGIQVTQGEGDLSFYAIGASGQANQISATIAGAGNNTIAFFNSSVPDGSYLIVKDQDSAGNEASTLYIRNTTGTTIDVQMEALSSFDFASIDLSSAPAMLTLNASDLERLTGPAQELTIKGGADDTVTLVGAARDASQDVSGYHAYALGDGIVLVDEDITPVI